MYLADRGRRRVREGEGELSEGVRDGENKERATTATYGTMFPTDEKDSLKKEGKRSYR